MRVSTLAAIAMGSTMALAPAQGAVVSFDGFTPATTCLPAITTDGLSFAPLSANCAGVWSSNPVSSNGTPGLIYGFGSMQMTADGGGSFVLSSFLAGISWYSTQTTATIGYTFDLTGGGTANGTFDIGRGFALYSFDKSITKATFTGLSDGYVAMDNVTFNRVPEPGTFALLGLGIAGLVASRKRK